MSELVLAVFILVYLGMILGRLPGLALDRTGVAMLGAIGLLAAGIVSPEAAWKSVDVPTMGLLFGLMVISAQFRLGGFYTRLARALSAVESSPQIILLLVILASAVLSALLANDIVCLAMTPILLESCVLRGVNPVPYLLALACASNIGSAATIIGNPQNMLIGQVAHLSFGGYFLDTLVPVLLGLTALWGIVTYLYRGQWQRISPPIKIPAPEFSLWQSGKGGVVLAAVVGSFLFTPWPREIVAMAGAGVLLLSRRMASRQFFALVDGQLLLLFMGLFIVNHGLASSGNLEKGFIVFRDLNVDLANPVWLTMVTVVLSNVISNVPAVMLLLPVCPGKVNALILALASTLAGNLFLLGSIANLIVVDQAAKLQVYIGWREHLRVGLPVTLASLMFMGAWLWFRWGNLFVTG